MNCVHLQNEVHQMTEMRLAPDNIEMATCCTHNRVMQFNSSSLTNRDHRHHRYSFMVGSREGRDKASFLFKLLAFPSPSLSSHVIGNE